MSEKARQNPFVGLRPFESKDSLYYFGRSEQTKAILRQLHATRFLAVVGSSGSGKSSLVRAGLIPDLEAGFLVQDRDLWQIAVMKPGDMPLHNLSKAVLIAIEESASPQEVESFNDKILRKGASAIVEHVKPVLVDKRDANMLLVVDQFEELFRFHQNRGDNIGDEEALDFVAIVLRLAEQTAAPIYVCMTMRSDFLGDCDTFHGLPEAMNRNQYLVPRLTRNQRREAIVGPMRLSGISIAPQLLDRLLNETMDTRDDLPVLQHALMRTWAEWAKNGEGPIGKTHYENVRTVKQDLNRHAEEALDELQEEEKLIAKRMFQTITETDSGNRRIRRPAHMSEIAAICRTTPEKVLAVIKIFRKDDRNFLTLSSENPTDDSVVDISHESLIRQWKTLYDWVDEEAESAKVYKRLAETSGLHAQNKAGLYREADLQVALSWQKEREPTEAWGVRYHGAFDKAIGFLNRSHNKHKEELREKEKRQKKKLLFTYIFSGVLFIFFVISVFFALWAIEKSKEAESERQASNLKRLEANYNLAKVFEEKALKALQSTQDKERKNNINGFKDAFLYTTAALQQDIGPDTFALKGTSLGKLMDPIAIKSAFAQRWFSPSRLLNTVITSVAFSPDGKYIASGSYDKSVRLWDVSTGEQVRELTGHTSPVSSVTFSPDGNHIASGSWDKSVRLWNLSLFMLFLKAGKPTPLLSAFFQGATFFWQVEQDGLEFRRKIIPSLFPQEGYYFVYDKRFRPLLNPPAPGQTKFDQILEWSKAQLLNEEN